MRNLVSCGISQSIGIEKVCEKIADRIHSNAGKTANGIKPNKNKSE
ncbi:hypothetical protein [Olleya namhaensis]|uniref:Uncharacterized protein n=1 Tax=Olleya namhaensis TaxID=1144750 RepID=A0A1I3PLT5_9FLAO|nr:hypothetical protein [Olleya namhaensis]SFJ22462.1 hypothetical protein SAMN05443431_105175 [Olleya namhaensis]